MRSKLRRWWKELTVATLLGLFLLVGAVDGPLFVGFTALMIGIGWAIGFSHRHMPVVDAIHETYRITRRMEEATEEAERAAQGPARPKLTLISRD